MGTKTILTIMVVALGLVGTAFANEDECLADDAREYNDWVEWDRPDCWCYPYQCRGDTDGKPNLLYPVAIPDLALFKAAFNKTDPVLATIPKGICCDFDHQKTLLYRVAIPDLGILKQYFNNVQQQVPACDQPPIYTGPYNFWTSP